MIIGVPREIKPEEGRVALTPAGAMELTKAGHEVRVEAAAGMASGFTDEQYRQSGASIVPDASDAWSAEMVVKVKEPIESEYKYLRDDLLLFTYLHLAADRPLTDALLSAGTTAIAYETVQTSNRTLPLLSPMSMVAGRLAAIVGAETLFGFRGGEGLLMSGVPGTHSAKVTVIGGGTAGTHATAMAAGMGARVSVLDTNLDRLAELDHHYAGRVQTLASNTAEIEAQVSDSDLVIGTVLIPGARAPKLVTDDLISRMKPGSVLVDVAVDQGGCFEPTHPTTHHDPTYPVHNSVLYAVANMPGAVPRTSTQALTNATLRYMLALAGKGWKRALTSDAALALGLNTTDGKLISVPVAAAFDLEATDVNSVLN